MEHSCSSNPWQPFLVGSSLLITKVTKPPQVYLDDDIVADDLSSPPITTSNLIIQVHNKIGWGLGYDTLLVNIIMADPCWPRLLIDTSSPFPSVPQYLKYSLIYNLNKSDDSLWHKENDGDVESWELAFHNYSNKWRPVYFEAPGTIPQICLWTDLRFAKTGWRFMEVMSNKCQQNHHFSFYLNNRLLKMMLNRMHDKDL